MNRYMPFATVAAWAIVLPGLSGCGGSAPETVDQASSALSFGTLPAPTGYWKFDDFVSGSTKVTDSSGNGLTGTASQVTPQSGFVGVAGQFNGSSSQVTIGDRSSLHFTNAVTIAAWVNPKTLPTLSAHSYALLAKWNGTTDSYKLLLTSGGYKFSIALQQSTGEKVVSVLAPASLSVANQWTHAAGIYDGSHVSLYVNGVLAAQAAASGTLRASTVPVVLGNAPTVGSLTYPLSGLLDEVWLSGQALTVSQLKQLAFGIWPNALSGANSDPYLASHHDDLIEMHPGVLALNFVNFGNSPSGQTTTNMVNDFNAHFVALQAGSRYHGYSDANAKAVLNYHLVKAVDLTDHGSPPSGWNHLNSSQYPLECEDPGAFSQFDYGALFDDHFASLYGIVDPSTGKNQNLCQLVASGTVHEVWIYVDPLPDQGQCPTFTFPDFHLFEILESKQVYDAAGNQIAGQFDPCAGNGCFGSDDATIAQACGRSIRINFVDSTRGPGCSVHGMGHGFESISRVGGPIPYLSANFQHFGNFDFQSRFAAPFGSWYGLCNALNSGCLTYPTDNSVVWGSPGTFSPYNQGCGNVHFPPNARNHYDDQNTTPVLSACEHFGLHDGPGGTDQLVEYTNAKSKMYDNLVPNLSDCEGGWQVYWRQSFPGAGNHAVAADGKPMKNWWPYVFY